MQQISTNYLDRIKLNLQSQKTAENPAVNPSVRQIDTLSNVTPDFNVSVPVGYQKIKDIKFPYDTTASLYKLSNGQNVIIIPKEGTTVVKSYVKTGSMNEPDNLRGISHFIEHNLFNGSKGLDADEFFTRVNEMGASSNAATGYAETNYYINSNLLRKGDLEEKIKLQASMLQSPYFLTDKLEKEKGIVNSEINMILSNPDNIGFNRAIKNLYNIQSTSVDLIGGTTDNITNLTREDVVDYFNRNYYPANTTTVITGEVDPDETIKLVAKYFNSTKTPPASRNYEKLQPVQSAVREDIISDKAHSTGIYAAFNGPADNDAKGQVLLKALSVLLTGSKNARISKELRDYNADVYMDVETVSTKPSDGLAIVFNGETTEENSPKVLRIIANKIDELKHKQPTPDEMSFIKKTLKRNFASNFECSANLNTIIGEATLDGILNSINDYEKMVDSLTPQDISNAAAKYLDTTKASIVLVHPDTIDEATLRKNHVAAQKITFTGNSDNILKKTAVNMDNVKSYKTSNNFQIITNNSKTNNCDLSIAFENLYSANVNPATPIILHKMLNAGSASRHEFDYLADLNKDAISVKFRADESGLGANAYFAAEDLPKTLDAINEVLLNPRITEATLDMAKKQILEAIELADKTPMEKLNKELFPNDNYGATDEDIKEGLKKVTLADVHGLYEYIMKNPSGSIVISAPFKQNPELLNTLAKHLPAGNKQFADINPAILDTYTPVAQTKVLTDTHNKNQADIVEAFKFKNNGNLKDDVTVTLLNIILGGNSSSRLFQDLRETEKLAYSVRSTVNYHDNTGIMKLRIGTTTENKQTGEISYDNVQKSIDGFNRHIQKIKTEKVSEKELENAKLYLKNLILSDNEDGFGKMISLDIGLHNYYGPSRENQFIDMIDNITVDDIYNMANHIFNSKPVYSINATPNTLAANKEYFKKLETV